MKTVLKAKWVIVILWIVAIAVLLITQPNMTELVRDKGQVMIPDGYSFSDANQLLDEMHKKNGKKTGTQVALVFHDKKGLSASDKEAIKTGLNKLKADKKTLGITTITDPFSSPDLKNEMVSKDGKTILTSIDVKHGNAEIKAASQHIYAALKDVKVDHYLTGNALIQDDYMESTQDGLHKTEYITVIFILLVLFIVFRSVVAPFVPLIAVGLSFLVSQSVVGFLVKWFDFPLSNFTQIFLVAVLFGIGTDYCILMINRFKEEIPKHETIDDAVISTFKNGGRTVFFSCLAVLVGFSTIGLSTFSIFKSAVGVAVGIVFLLLAMVTIVPFFMSTLGTKLFWPMKKSIGHSESKLWGSVGRFALKRPLIALAIVAIIVVPFIITYNGNENFNSLSEMSDRYPSVKGYNLIAKSFNPGEAMPATIVMKNDEPMNHRQYLQTIEAITREIKKVDHVKTVRSATEPMGEPLKDFLVPNQALTLKKGLDQANDGIKKVSGGLNDAGQKLEDSAPQLKNATDGIDDLISGTTALQNGVDQLQTGLKQVENGIRQGAQGAGDLQKGLEQAKGAAEDLLDNHRKLLKSYQTIQANLGHLTSQVNQMTSGFKQQLGLAKDEITQNLSGNIDDIIGSMEQFKTSSAYRAMNSAAKKQFDQTLAEVKSLKTDHGIDQAFDRLNQYIQSTSGDLLNKINQLSSGLNQLNQALKTTNQNYADVIDGQAAFTSSLQKIIDGIDRLEKGLNQAANGQNAITQKAPALSEGLGKVNDGQSQLKQGFSGLSDQMAQLVDGLKRSVDGLNNVSGGLGDAGQFLDELSESNSSLAGFYIPDQALENKDFKQSLDHYMSKDRKFTTMDVIFDVNPYSIKAMDEIKPIKDAVHRAIKDTPLENVKFGVGGVTSMNDDLRHISDDDYSRTVILMLVGIGIILIAVLRSLIMPLYIIASLVLTYFTSMGISEALFVNILGYQGINWAVPFFGFVLLIALGVDYSIFMMDRFNEYRDLSPSEAILRTMKNMGTVILSAAVILGGTFAAMMPSGVMVLIEIATITISGLLLYTLLILPLFVPVMVRLFGKANWWPFKKED